MANTKATRIKRTFNTYKVMKIDEKTELFDAFDLNSRLVSGDGAYSFEEAFGFIEGKSVMLEDDFKECAAKIAKDFAYWLNNNWFVPAQDGFWKQDSENFEYELIYELSIEGIDQNGIWNTDELFDLFNSKKGNN